ncbi:unnamed protein product [Protopolystoma xenopodis]|uniref:Uncharacterized protein n=1 Tax=Protopolystoma xenopodis TaxID=117903 RepID=A0A448WP16_9PLAT|nr:unnamed protein product [Protopolystoma xenopodis]
MSPHGVAQRSTAHRTKMHVNCDQCRMHQQQMANHIFSTIAGVAQFFNFIPVFERLERKFARDNAMKAF